MSQMLNPPKITDARKADMAIEVWDDRLVKLHAEYGEKITSKLQVAVLYSMLPKDLQEKTLDKCAVTWGKTKENDAEGIIIRADQGRNQEHRQVQEGYEHPEADGGGCGTS